MRRRVVPRLWARLRGLPPPPIPDLGGIAIAGAQTRGTTAQARGLGKRGLAAFIYRRDAAAVILVVVLWLFGLWARPDFWGGLDNSFTILLAFSEIALLAVGLTFVMANGDIDLSVGSVLALSGAVAAVIMKDTELRPARRRRSPRSSSACWPGVDQRLADRLCRPARLHRDARHVLLGARHRLVDRRGHPAQRLSRILQPDRPQSLRTAQRMGRGARPRAGCWRSPRRSACRRSS